jgi:hypothetical protein
VLAYQRIAVVKNYSGLNLLSVSVYMGLLGTELLLQVRLGSTILILSIPFVGTQTLCAGDRVSGV